MFALAHNPLNQHHFPRMLGPVQVHHNIRVPWWNGLSAQAPDRGQRCGGETRRRELPDARHRRGARISTPMRLESRTVAANAARRAAKKETKLAWKSAAAEAPVRHAAAPSVFSL